MDAGEALTYFLLSLTNDADSNIRADFADSVCRETTHSVNNEHWMEEGTPEHTKAVPQESYRFKRGYKSPSAFSSSSRHSERAIADASIIASEMFFASEIIAPRPIPGNTYLVR